MVQNEGNVGEGDDLAQAQRDDPELVQAGLRRQ